MNDGPYVIQPDQRPAPLKVVGTEVTILASAAKTGAYGITFQSGEEGNGPPPHFHEWDEAFYVISGEVNFQCAGEHHVCVAGTLVHVPRNTVHAFSYRKGGGSMMEITSSNGTSTEMFTAFDAEINADSDVADMIAVLNRNGVQVAT